MVTTEKIMYLVVDNAFNRYNYPSLIGKRFETPPAYAVVRKLTEQEILKRVREDGGEVEVERTTKMAQNAELKFIDDEIRPIG